MGNDPLADRLALRRAEWRLDGFDRWREGADKRMSSVEQRLGELDKAAEIARAVAQKEATRVVSERKSRYSRVELIGASVVAACSIGGLVLQLIHAAGHG